MTTVVHACAQSECEVRPVSTVVGRCFGCKVIGEEAACAVHARDLIAGMMAGLLRSRCCNARVTLVRVVPL
jgi:hypothetical protein